ncbi:MAG: iron ABC transporter permease [Alphaproteobacteria bacterium]|nr:iron ABC transporter permease [Alphaproteobacteria bacterium]
MIERQPVASGALPLVTQWRAMVARRGAMVALGMVGLALSVVLDIAVGPSFLPLSVVAAAVFGGGSDAAAEVIVWTIRMPIALIALAVGAALGLSGAIMQTILNNPLASSYTLGVSTGAGFGAALVIVLGSRLGIAEDWAIPIASCVFSGIVCAAVWGIGRLRGATPELLVLAGIALLFLFQALLALLQYVATQEALQQIVFWLFGSLQKATWSKMWIILATFIIVLAVILRDAWALTALKLGDERAAGLGVDVRALRFRCFVCISVLTGVAVAFVGTIGFVGLVGPHIARILVGEDQRLFLPASAVSGALLLSLSSLVSKLVLPGAVFPIGIVTALIGVPFFIWMILGMRRGYW